MQGRHNLKVIELCNIEKLTYVYHARYDPIKGQCMLHANSTTIPKYGRF